MAKRPTTSKPAADKPAPATQSPGAPTASAAGEPSAGTPAEGDRSASVGQESPATGEAATQAAVVSKDDPPVTTAKPPAEESASAGQAADLEGAIEGFKAASQAHALAVIALTEAALAGPPGSARRALDAIAEAQRITVDVGLNLAGLEIQAREDRGRESGELVTLEVRSRSRRQFRRAGLVLGDAYQMVHVTAAQAEALRADRKGVQIKGEN